MDHIVRRDADRLQLNVQTAGNVKGGRFLLLMSGVTVPMVFVPFAFAALFPRHSGQLPKLVVRRVQVPGQAGRAEDPPGQRKVRTQLLDHADHDQRDDQLGSQKGLREEGKTPVVTFA